tara:strand:+ start:599 stop:712 length:114 start_codon:yes stop_codon:yes gene_type:complete
MDADDIFRVGVDTALVRCVVVPGALVDRDFVDIVVSS